MLVDLKSIVRNLVSTCTEMCRVDSMSADLEEGIFLRNTNNIRNQLGLGDHSHMRTLSMIIAKMRECVCCVEVVVERSPRLVAPGAISSDFLPSPQTT